VVNTTLLPVSWIQLFDIFAEQKLGSRPISTVLYARSRR
jgi:hypothetical protein